jgi:squalene monooxygenase
MNFQTVQEVLPRSMANLTAKFVQYDWKIQTAFYVAASITLLYTLVYHLLPMVTRRRRLSNEALKSIKKNYTLENPEVIIVGAGIAGPALAKALGDQGRKVAIFERDLSEPDRIVGEFMQPGGIALLKKLGLENCLEEIDGQKANGYYVFTSPTDFVPLPFPGQNEGKSFHHGRFVMNLRRAILNHPNIRVIEAAVTGLLEEGDVVTGISYKLKSGETKTMNSPLTVVCDGCSSNFRKQLVKFPDAVAKSRFVGVIVKGKMPFEGYGHVFLCNPAPVLSYRIGTEEVRVLVDIPEPAPKSIPDYLINHTAPQLPDGFREAFIEGVKSGVRGMMNSKLHPAPLLRKGVVPIGDTWNMRHPLTGGGMTVAFSDAVQMAEAFAAIPDLKDISAVQHQLDKEYLGNRKPLASTINILSWALYGVFAGASDDPAVVEAIRNACFGYFKLGGICVSGPMSLLSGLTANPFVLLSHYVMVALYGAWQLLTPFPTPSKILLALKVLYCAYQNFFPVMVKELWSPKFYKN